MLGTPIPWFAGSKGKGLSWASLCFPQPHPHSPSPGHPLQGKVPWAKGLISSETQLPHLWNDGRPVERPGGMFLRIPEKCLAQGLTQS